MSFSAIHRQPRQGGSCLRCEEVGEADKLRETHRQPLDAALPMTVSKSLKPSQEGAPRKPGDGNLLVEPMDRRNWVSSFTVAKLKGPNRPSAVATPNAPPGAVDIVLPHELAEGRCRIEVDDAEGRQDRLGSEGPPRVRLGPDEGNLKSIAFYRDAICALLRSSSRDWRHLW
jgi:hypothetical protein